MKVRQGEIENKEHVFEMIAVAEGDEIVVVEDTLVYLVDLEAKGHRMIVVVVPRAIFYWPPVHDPYDLTFLVDPNVADAYCEEVDEADDNHRELIDMCVPSEQVCFALDLL